MSKVLRVSIAVLAILAVAAPAMAQLKFGGYFRTQATMEQVNPGQSDSDSDTYIDNRFRAKFDYSLNDYVSATYYGEVDVPWGERGSTPSGSTETGGKLSADGVNVETKNVYLDVKLPETTWATRIGVQGFSDHAMATIVSDDMAGIKVNGKLGPMNTTFFYSKWDEGDRNNWDDTDFYAVQLDHAYSEMLNVGFDVFFLDLNSPVSNASNRSFAMTDSGEDFYYTLHGDFRFDVFAVDGFFVYRDLSVDGVSGSPDVDGSAWLASGKGHMKLANGEVGLRVLYYSEDDDDTDFNSFSPAEGEFAFYDENLMLFLSDYYYNNSAGGRRALIDAAYAGYGLWGAVLSTNLKLQDDWYVKGGLGYFAAVDDERNDEATASREGTSLGTEVAAMVGKKIAGKVDVSLRGAYAFLGDFYDEAAADGDDSEDFYKVVGMINVPF